jgi:8-oxo-dGTP pyrophosphatase MutT (NUDIX family)
MERYADGAAKCFPVSVKGVMWTTAGVVLLRNEREEWELPGGKLESGESPEECLRREVREELSLEVEARRLLDSWVYQVLPTSEVLIVTYGCLVVGGTIQLSNEHQAVGAFRLDQLGRLRLPDGYRASIASWPQGS